MTSLDVQEESLFLFARPSRVIKEIHCGKAFSLSDEMKLGWAKWVSKTFGPKVISVIGFDSSENTLSVFLSFSYTE
jgi:hypothetical protein